MTTAELALQAHIDKQRSQQHSCPSCAVAMEPFYAVANVPTNSCILLNSREEALDYPRGDIVLGSCARCGFICNLAFRQEMAEYSGRYEETQGYSPFFRRYHRKLAQDLITRYELKDKTVLEVGCGKGEFLALFSELGGNHGIGFDPGYDDARGILGEDANIEVIQDFYCASYQGYQADLVCCKMTLEHIAEPSGFVRLLKQGMRQGVDAILYLQVPESLRILRDCAFEDIYYEHCCYFTADSLGQLLNSHGLSVKRLYTSYGDQYLVAEAGLADESSLVPLDAQRAPNATRRLLGDFTVRMDRKVDQWRRTVAELSSAGSVVVWGSGSKAVSFLGLVDTEHRISHVVDINPYRQGHFMVGSALPIIAPAALKDLQPAAVIVMNRLYLEEIEQSLLDSGVEAQVMAL